MTSVQPIMGVFTEKKDVGNAIMHLKKAGYNPKDISLIMKDADQAKEVAHHTGVSIGSSTAAGAATGAALGGLAGLLVGVGAIALPGVGAFLVGGPLAAALGLSGAAASTATGALTGAVAGGLVGALMSLGLPKHEAEHYDKRVQEGAILLVVPAYQGQEAEVEEVLTRFHATDIRSLNVATTVKMDDHKLGDNKKTLHHRDDTHHDGAMTDGHDYENDEEHTRKDMRHADGAAHADDYVGERGYRDDHHTTDNDHDSHDHADPTYVQKFLQHADYPASKHQLLLEAKDEGADAQVVHMLDELPDQNYKNSRSVSDALGSLHH